MTQELIDIFGERHEMLDPAVGAIVNMDELA